MSDPSAEIIQPDVDIATLDHSKPTPVTVLTGFLGAGKTSLILSLLKQLKPDYKVVVLKNEFGDIEVDSLLANQPSISGVSEIQNGCVCCVLVGQLRNALLEIKSKFNPDRVILESSGSAFPAALAWQVRELERETKGALTLDAVVTVVDCINFTGYEDTSPTAKMQAKYTDMIILNKWDLVTDRQLDTVLDHLFTLNDETPMLRHSPTAPLAPSLLFGLDSKLFSRQDDASLSTASKGWNESEAHSDEVESLGVWRGRGALPSHEGHAHAEGEACTHGGVVVDEPKGEAKKELNWDGVVQPFLATLPASIYRVKGLLRLPPPPSVITTSSASITPYSAQPLPPTAAPTPAATPPRTDALPTPPSESALEDDGHERLYILNWAFGRYTLTELPVELRDEERFEGVEVRLTVMGERGGVRRWTERLRDVVGGLVR